MPNTTTNYSLYKPLVNDATDEDLWGGYINDSMDLIDTQMKANADAITALSSSTQLPVGSYYINETDSTNPGTLLGYGTWTAVTDKFLVGHGSTYTSTGGAATVTLSQSNIPSYNLSVTTYGNLNTGTKIRTADSSGGTGTANISSGGSGSSFSIIPPYQAAYIWKRTA